MVAPGVLSTGSHIQKFTQEKIMSDNSWITKEALHAAMDIVYENLQGEWPHDDWEQIDPTHDINMFSDETGKYATLYPVINGEAVDTTRFVRVFDLRYKHGVT
jgi:hypothetical protein